MKYWFMSKTSELWYENNRNGFETFLKGMIKGEISFKFFTGQIDKDNWMFQDYDIYENIVDGLYLECLPKIEETIRDVIKVNFECLKRVS